MKSTPQTHFSSLIQEFFLERLMRQRNSSPQTVAAYRDCFRLLFEFAREHQNKPTDRLVLADLDASLVLAFLDHLEKVRKNSIRSRNARLAAIRSFLRFAVLKDPQSLATIQRVLAIPMKRHSRPLVGFLSREEVQALISAPDPFTRSGQRDQAFLATLYNTGARVSEAINITIADLALDASPSIRLHGKGRKDRAVPIWPATALTPSATGRIEFSAKLVLSSNSGYSKRPFCISIRAASATTWLAPPAATGCPKKLVCAFSSNAAFSDDDPEC